MKRFVVLVAVLALLSVGFAAVADPIQVGGTSLTASSRLVAQPGNGHGNAWGLAKKAPTGDVVLLSSPIQVGGT